ncbi:lipopolysaccharide heptosyltransferase II [Parelusimicrobium proximum]|uniref:lipopolysaccharide heptosyltransferase II n=1 Tax=Parelusimicrobium proximum TaxID=3228953 RepID=UPI003D1875AC
MNTNSNTTNDKEQQPNILVIRLSSLGDIVLTSPVFKNLKAKWPGCRITLLTKKQFAEVLSCNPDVDEIMVLKGNNAATISEVRKRHFTHLLDLHGNLRSRIISAGSGIPNKLRYDKSTVARRMYVKFRKQSPELEKHTLERYLDVLKAWDVPVEYTAPEFGDWSYKGQPSYDKKVRKIAIFQTSFIGDTILTTPLVQKTAKLFPDAKVVIITRPETAEIFNNMPEVSEVILLDKKGFLKKLFGIFSTAKAIRKSGVDIILVPHRGFRSALIAWLSRVPIRIGFNSSEGKFFYTKTIPFSWLTHDAERNLSLLHGIVKENFKAEELNLQSVPTPEENLKRLMHDFQLEGKTLVGMHPGAAWPTKRWLEERYTELAKRLGTELNLQVVLVGGSSDAEMGERIRQVTGEYVSNLCGKTSLMDLMALMRHFKLFITNDSGPMHIATAFSVPTLAIFGPTTRELGFFPYGKGHRVIEVEGLACRPCALHGGKTCPEGHFKCMRDISVERVFDNAKEMLQETGVVQK